jgi:molybdopterin molybdotransferase
MVDLVLTGGEVDPEGVPAPGRVRDVYGPQLPGLLVALGCAIGTVRRTADDPERLEDAVAGSRAQLVITTGGTGRGPTDHLRAVLDRLGCALPVAGVGVRPGHPTLLAVRPDGTPVLCLPGNPFAAFAALLAVGGPLIDALCGRTGRPPGQERAGEPFPNEGASVRLVAVRRTAHGVTPVARQGPAMLTGLVHADGLALVPPGGLRAGAPVGTLAFPW